MNIKGLDKAEVLAALFNASRQQGMGFMHSLGASPMTVDQAQEELKNDTYFDYLHGRVMKIALMAMNWKRDCMTATMGKAQQSAQLHLCWQSNLKLHSIALATMKRS